MADPLTSWLTTYQQARFQDSVNTAGHITDDANTYAANLVNNANADAANSVRTTSNSLSAMMAALGNLQRSIGNQNKLEAAGAQLDTNAENLARIQDSMTRGSLEQGLRASEQLGALHAAAAANGVGGASAAMMHQTLALSAARQKTTQDENAGYQTYDMLMQRRGLVGNMVRSLDQGQTFAPIDYTVNIAPLVQSPLRMQDYAPSPAQQAFMSALGSATGSGMMSDIGSYFAANNRPPVSLTNSLDMNDGWNNFSTKNFSSTPGLGSGTYGLGDSTNGFFSASDAFQSTRGYLIP